MKRDHLKLLTACCLMLLLFTYPADAQESRTQTVTLAGYKMTPSVLSSGSGSITLTVKKDSLIVSGSFSDLSAPYQSSGIYYTRQEMAVNRLLRLDAELNEDHTGGEFRASENRFRLSDALNELLTNGELSIRIGTTLHNKGEIGCPIPAIK